MKNNCAFFDAVAGAVTNGSAVRQVAEGSSTGVYLAGGGAAAGLLLLTLAAAAAAYFTSTKNSSRGSIK